MEGLLQVGTGDYGGFIQYLLVTLVALHLVLDAEMGYLDVVVGIPPDYLLVADRNVLSAIRELYVQHCLSILVLIPLGLTYIQRTIFLVSFGLQRFGHFRLEEHKFSIGEANDEMIATVAKLNGSGVLPLIIRVQFSH